MANTTGKKYGGRKKGTPNKDTKELRQAIAAFTSKNMDRIQGLFDEVASDDPAKALELWLKTVSYSTPTLKAIEHSGEISEGKPSKIILQVGDNTKGESSDTVGS